MVLGATMWYAADAFDADTSSIAAFHLMIMSVIAGHGLWALAKTLCLPVALNERLYHALYSAASTTELVDTP